MKKLFEKLIWKLLKNHPNIGLRDLIFHQLEQLVGEHAAFMDLCGKSMGDYNSEEVAKCWKKYESIRKTYADLRRK